MLLVHGADPNVQDNARKSTSTLLHIAISRRDMDLVRTLLAHENIDPNIPNRVPHFFA